MKAIRILVVMVLDLFCLCASLF